MHFKASTLERLSKHTAFFVPQPFTVADLDSDHPFMPIARAVATRTDMLVTLAEQSQVFKQKPSQSLAIAFPKVHENSTREQLHQTLDKVVAEITAHGAPVSEDVNLLEMFQQNVEKVFTRDSAVALCPLFALAYHHYETKNYEHALQLAKKGTAQAKALSGLPIEVTVGALYLLGKIYLATESYEDALKCFRDASMFRLNIIF